MEYISSPTTWFLRDKNTIVGLTKNGIKAISQQGITSIALPSEKDGFILSEIHDSFFQVLADSAPQIDTVCTPPTVKVKIYDSVAEEKQYPLICSFKRLIVSCAMSYKSEYTRLCFNDHLEAIELLEDPIYSTQDGIVFTKDFSEVVFYPRSRRNEKYVLPETVIYIGKFAFQNTKYLEILSCSKKLKNIADYAFDNSSISVFLTPNGNIKDNLASKDAFTNCNFAIPTIISAYTPEEANSLTLEALKSSKLDDWPNEAFKYLTSISDEIADAFLNRLKGEHNRRVTLDAGIFLPLMDRQLMTKKLYEIYDYLMDYRNFDYTLPTKDLIIIRNSIEQFKLYRLTGHKGEVQQDEAFDTGCYITGHKPSKLIATEENIKKWLKHQIVEAIETGKTLFITKTCAGVCCLAAETIIILKQQYPDIKLLLMKDAEYEYEKVGFGEWDHLAGRVAYDIQPTTKSLEWKPRIDSIKELADMIIYIKNDIPSWIADHCARIISTWHLDELHRKLREYADKKGIQIITYE